MVTRTFDKPLILPTDIEYPDSDGKPMGETGLHVLAIFYVFEALRDLLLMLRAADDIYVAADMFLYYEEGNPRAVKAPDVMVIKGVVDGHHERNSFKTWVEHAMPAVVIEVTSKSTWVEDVIQKSDLYARLGVKEYFIFDPLREYLEPQLRGFQLDEEDMVYVEMTPAADGSLFSHELDVIFRPDGRLLRVVDALTGEDIPALDDKLQRLHDLSQRAEQEARRAEQEARRAEQEARRAAAAEAEVLRLRALLEKQNGSALAPKP